MVYELVTRESWWQEHYNGIKESGYELRLSNRRAPALPNVMDAIRLRDGSSVLIKRVLPEAGQHELELTQNRSNPCVPLLDVIVFPNTSHKLIVMPFLRPFDDYPFQTYEEFVSFFMQICECLRFMHERNIAHRACTAKCIMRGPSATGLRGSDTTQNNQVQNIRERPSDHYYLIDFGLSHQYSSRNASDLPPRGHAIYDGSIPEHRNEGSCNPFRTDIYRLGKLVRENFMQKYNGFRFMQELINAMTAENPEVRPTIEAVVERFTLIRNSLSRSALRSPITRRKDSRVPVLFRYIGIMIRRLRYNLQRRPSLQDP